MYRVSLSAALGIAGALVLVLSIDSTRASEPANIWRDPSRHVVQLVPVDEGVRVEVLNWGGSGRDLVLLAGSGNTAHVFDDFAPKLTRFGHVYGITRRGYGASTAPEDGYSEQRLAEDVLHVIEKLKLKAPVLIGHSMSGEEMTRLGDNHSALLSGLVYLDALEDPKDVPADNPQYMALVKKLPAGIHKTGGITKDDKSSFAALARWYKWRIGVAFPESEFRNMYEANPDGSVGKIRASDRTYDLIGKGADPKEPHGINEVRLRRGEIVREGLHTSLAELRRLGRKGWRKLCPRTTIFCIGREKAKLSYFWKHCYGKSRSGRYLGSLTNPDTGCPVETDGVRLSALDFEKKRLHEIVEDSKAGKTKYSALWQADGNKIVRMAPTEYMGRFMPEWWDYAIADEIHQLAGDTAQGNALGVLNKTARRFLGLTGTSGQSHERHTSPSS